MKSRQMLIQVDRKRLQNIRELEYIGVIISSNRKAQEEVRNVVNKANRHQFSNASVGKKELSTKIK